MTTRFDKTRDALWTALVDARQDKFLTESEFKRILEAIDDCIEDLESNHPREETV